MRNFDTQRIQDRVVTIPTKVIFLSWQKLVVSPIDSLYPVFILILIVLILSRLIWTRQKLGSVVDNQVFPRIRFVTTKVTRMNSTYFITNLTLSLLPPHLFVHRPNFIIFKSFMRLLYLVIYVVRGLYSTFWFQCGVKGTFILFVLRKFIVQTLTSQICCNQ